MCDTCGFILNDSHWWVYAIGVWMTDGCWGRAVIHVGLVLCARRVWIGRGEPVKDHTHRSLVKIQSASVGVRVRRPLSQAGSSASQLTRLTPVMSARPAHSGTLKNH